MSQTMSGNGGGGARAGGCGCGCSGRCGGASGRTSGRWYRQGDRIVVETGSSAPSAGGAGSGRVGRVLSAVGLQLSQREMQELLSGAPISLEERPVGEVGRVLERAEDLSRRVRENAGEMETAGGSCRNCKGACIPITKYNCLCFGLFGVSYCRVWDYPMPK